MVPPKARPMVCKKRIEPSILMDIKSTQASLEILERMEGELAQKKESGNEEKTTNSD